MQDALHEADNNWSGVLGNLLNTGINVAGSIIAPERSLNNSVKQNGLTTPGAQRAGAGVASFNWQPWAIGGGIIVALLALLMFFRKR